jgi:hypothetical protein
LNQEHNPLVGSPSGAAPNKAAAKPGPITCPPNVPTYSVGMIELIWQREMEAAILRLHKRLEAERKKLSRQYWARFWPVGVGIMLSCFAPALKETLNLLFHPWGMAVVFPFVVLSGRPELHLGSHWSSVLPQFMLYAEFPLEGYLAKSIIVGKVKPLAVLGRVACLHILAGALLLMVSGAIY